MGHDGWNGLCGQRMVRRLAPMEERVGWLEGSKKDEKEGKKSREAVA